MGSFSRAFSAALQAAGLSHTDAARLTGLTQTSVSRSAAGGTLPSVRNLAHLLGVLHPADRHECLRQYLLELTPEEYQNRVVLSFAEATGRAKPADTRLDTLGSAIVFLDREATSDKHLANVLIELARTLSGASAAQFIPSTVAQVEKAEARKRARRAAARAGKRPTASASSAQSPKRVRRSAPGSAGLAAC